MTSPLRAPRRAPVLAAALALTATLAACGEARDDNAASDSRTPAAREATSASPRLVVGHEGGVTVLDAEDLSVEATASLDGFTRLNPAGDDRHVMLSTGSSFRVLDTGAWSHAHGDHAHHYVAKPRMTDISFDSQEPGHVVHHAERTALFSDGTGLVESFDPADLADGRPTTAKHRTPEAHHGVAVHLDGGRLMTTIGDEDGANGVVVLDHRGDEVLRDETCPGTHGEAVAQGAVVVGCEDGMLVLKGDAFTKVDSPDAYGRMGNQAGHEDSPVVLGDYKTDPDAELERPSRVSLVDTRDGTLDLVDLGTSYSFRSLGRGPAGEGLVLGTDGSLHVLDVEAASVTRSIPVVEPWEESTEWQEPRPTLFVLDDTAYVTEPATRTVKAVDLASGEVTASTVLDAAPNELTGVRG